MERRDSKESRERFENRSVGVVTGDAIAIKANEDFDRRRGDDLGRISKGDAGTVRLEK